MFILRGVDDGFAVKAEAWESDLGAVTTLTGVFWETVSVLLLAPGARPLQMHAGSTADPQVPAGLGTGDRARRVPARDKPGAKSMNFGISFPYP